MEIMEVAMVGYIHLQEVALIQVFAQLTDVKLFKLFHPSEPASQKALVHHMAIQVIHIQVLKIMTLLFRVKPIAHALVVCSHVSMNGLSDAASSTLLQHQQHIGVNDEFQVNASLLKAGLPSQSEIGVKVSRIEGIVLQAGRS